MKSDSKRPSVPRGAVGARGRRRRRLAHREGTLETMERLLTHRVSLSVCGEPKQVSATEAIVLQLMQKALSGNGRAWRALLKYRDFAKSHSDRSAELRFVESEYTQAFAKSAARGDDG
jgi:hypothetical protein